MQLPNNFLLVNKPATWTSFDVVGFIRSGLRRVTKQKNIKVGHAGTLDPFATGLLIIGVGREATRTIDQFKNLPKTYRATVTLGAISDTLDSTGKITPTETKNIPSETEVQNVLNTFLGQQLQTPPMYSAKQIGGVRLYTLARQGKEVEREPVTITIHNLTLLSYSWPELTIEVTCSAGTYIRTLAADIGVKLGTGAYCSTLERTAIGDFSLTDARPPDQALHYLQTLLTP